MPSGPMKTPFEDYVGDPIPNGGKKGGGAQYDTYSGLVPGDSATPSSVVGSLLTEVDAPTGSTGKSEIY